MVAYKETQVIEFESIDEVRKSILEEQGYAFADEVPQSVLDLQSQAELDKVEAEKKSEAQQYLDSTDWYYARLAETGEEVPAEVVSKRKESRNMLRSDKEGE
jgi:hypothetical protein